MHRRTAFDDRSRRRQRWTEFRLLGYRVENDLVLLRLGRTPRRLRALRDVGLVRIRPEKVSVQHLICEATRTEDGVHYSFKFTN